MLTPPSRRARMVYASSRRSLTALSTSWESMPILIAAAAEGTSKVSEGPSARDVDRWLAGLSGDEHVALLSRVARGEGGVGAELMRRFRPHATRPTRTQTLRTAGTLRARAEELAEQRRQGAVAREAKARARRDREQAAARERHLNILARRQAEAWRRLDALVDTKHPACAV